MPKRARIVSKEEEEEEEEITESGDLEIYIYIYYGVASQGGISFDRLCRFDMGHVSRGYAGMVQGMSH